MQYESEDVVLAVNLHEGVIRGWFVADRAFLMNIINVIDHFSYAKCLILCTCHVIGHNFTVQCDIELKFSLKVPYYLLIT